MTYSTRRCFSIQQHARTLHILPDAMPMAIGPRTVRLIASILPVPFLPNEATKRRCTSIRTCYWCTILRRRSSCRHSAAIPIRLMRTPSFVRHGCGRRAMSIVVSSRSRSILATYRSTMRIRGEHTLSQPDCLLSITIRNVRHSGVVPKA